MGRGTAEMRPLPAPESARGRDHALGRSPSRVRTACDCLGAWPDSRAAEDDDPGARILAGQHLCPACGWLVQAPGGRSEIAALQEQLLTSEATVHSLQAALRQRNELIGQLQPRAELLQDICRWRPPVAGLLAALAEAERLGPLPTGDPSHPPPSGPGPGLANSTGDEEDRNHLQPAVFGTTV
ncbi:vimentin-type intermediate filament-associated coiled-coil protein isoform X1 [Felis catus]|uniref:vimentin-type intermediate filament-associated coiled-coil protein isoform X1 n=1 Tax=Felis catus TaxID=9685 RepID=UPI001D19E00F|nr:vimentin-type intermediate filament-associated coiled-coil protein isoform X1 [Felis catus]